LLKKIDRGVLTIWVLAEDCHRTAAMMQARLDANTELPLLVKTSQGLMPSPYVYILDKVAKVMLRAASELGFSPVSRSRVRIPVEPASADPTNAWAALRLIPGGRKDPNPAT
jgi:phage terminase small subunit